MGISDMFGFGKKGKQEKKEHAETTPFRPPREVALLRGRIETESRENFPNHARCEELVRDAEEVFRMLKGIIAEGEYAEEAIRIRDDLKKKLDALEAKIKSNRTETGDYVDKNIDYLQRKSNRNTAKTHFTEFLDAYDLFLSCCREGGAGQGPALDSATTAMITALSTLSTRFIKIYKQDHEIQGLKDKALGKIRELADYCTTNAAGLEGKGLKSQAEANAKRLQNEARRLSES